MDEFDFDATFGDDYLYFYSERLGDERSDSETETIISVLGLKSGDRVADVACGHGRIANRLARKGAAVSGLDAAPHFLEMARSQADEWDVDAGYEQGDMRQLPWAPASFDAVISWFTSFGYFSDEENLSVLKEFERVLRPGGQLLIETLNREFIVREMVPVSVTERGDDFLIDKYNFDSETGRIRTERIVVRSGKVTRARHFVRLYTFSELRGLLERLGFTDCRAFGQGGVDFTVKNPRMLTVATKI